MAKKPLAGVHLVLGEDSYLAEQELEAILAEAIGSDRNDALTVLQGDEVKWERVVAEARSGSLFAARRAVVVRRADLIRGPKADEEAGEAAAKKGKARATEDPVLDYLESPPPDTTLVLLAAKPDRRRNPWKRLCAEGEVHSAEPKKGRALRAYVEEDLRRRGLRLTGDAIGALVDEVGQDLRRLMGEVDKLEAWDAGRGKGTLSADEVLDVLGRGIARPLYLLADDVAARERTPALQKLLELLEADEDEFKFKIVATLHRSLRQARAARALGDRRTPRPQIGARLLPPHMQFKLDSLLAAAGRWSDSDLHRALAAVAVADRRMKRGADAATALVAALAEACGPEAGAATSRTGR